MRFYPYSRGIEEFRGGSNRAAHKQAEVNNAMKEKEEEEEEEEEERRRRRRPLKLNRFF